MEEEWGLWEGQCVACDMYGRINDLQLCKICAAKLERDLMRLRGRCRPWLPDEAAASSGPEVLISDTLDLAPPRHTVAAL